MAMLAENSQKMIQDAKARFKGFINLIQQCPAKKMTLDSVCLRRK